MFGLFYDRFFLRWENGGTSEAVTAAYQAAFNWVRTKLRKDDDFSKWYDGFVKVSPAVARQNRLPAGSMRRLRPDEMSEILGRAKEVLDRAHLYEWADIEDDNEPYTGAGAVEQTLTPQTR